MAVKNIDAMTWALDTSVRVALFVPTTADGSHALGAARSVYYCPHDFGAICDLNFELYAVVEDWVDGLRLSRYLHNSYTFVMGKDASTSQLLLASLPGVSAYDMEPEQLYVGIDERPDLDFAHPALSRPTPVKMKPPPEPASDSECAMELETKAPPPVEPKCVTRVVRIRMQNHHILGYLANRFHSVDELEMTVAKDTKRKAAFALLYMHHPTRVHAPAAAAAEAAAARRKKPTRAPAATRHDNASMFRGSAPQRVLAWDDTGKRPAKKETGVLTGQLKAPAEPASADVLRLLERDKKAADEKLAREKAKKKEGGATTAPKRRVQVEMPHLRLVRTTTPQAVFLQQLVHIKIDAFVHEHEREIAEFRAKAAETARMLVNDYMVMDEKPPSPALGAKKTASETRAKNAKVLAFTFASALAANVPPNVAEYVSGRLTPGPVPAPFHATPDEVRRAYGTRPPLLAADVDDPNSVQWLVPVDYVRFSRELGHADTRGVKRAREESSDTLATSSPVVPVVESVAVKEEPDNAFLDLSLYTV